MGHPMAGQLLKAGQEVALWSHSAAKAQELAKAGKGTACATPKDVAAQSDFIFYCVGDTEMSRELALGKDGLIEGAKKGTVIADCSTVAPSASRKTGAAFAAKGVHYLDAPCTGSKPGAENAALTFMVGGDEKAFESAKPYFEIMGKRLYYCGGPGKGLQAKLTQNLMLSNIMEAMSEGFVLAAKGGIKPELMLDILDNSAAKSNFVSFKAPFIFKRDFATNFSAKWMHKDVGLALDLAKEMDLPLPITSVTHQMFQAAIAKGWGEDDLCGTIRVMEDWAGVKVEGS